MENDFDIDPEDLEFEDSENDLDDFDDFDEEEFGEVQMRTAVLSKNNMVALLCVKTATEGGAICRVDPRENNPSVQIPPRYSLFEVTTSIVVAVPKSQTIQVSPYFSIAAKATSRRSMPRFSGGK